MKNLTDITDADIHSMNGLQLAELIDRANRDATIVENKSVQSREHAHFVRRARLIMFKAKQALQAINLKSEQSMHDMIAGTK